MIGWRINDDSEDVVRRSRRRLAVFVNAVTGWPPAVAWTSAVLRGLPPGPKFKSDFQPLPPGFPGS